MLQAEPHIEYIHDQHNIRGDKTSYVCLSLDCQIIYLYSTEAV